ncbi:NAD-capped RNA hydrolase NudC (DeNADding enzyme NudC) (NADH pyrophosphatase) [Durusdinium trenchii]|uniref:NAD(+) diphosphatase n=1 Tax=Durusdinium trenchii TaxID=1381693 RepID=A0ABP0PKQ8_9DINO
MVPRWVRWMLLSAFFGLAPSIRSKHPPGVSLGRSFLPRAVAFNTEGRFQRGAPPSEATPHGASMVPIYRGMSLVSETATGELEPVLLSSEQVQMGEASWLGTAEESSALAELQRKASHRLGSGFWMLDVSNCFDQAPSLSDLGLREDFNASPSVSSTSAQWHKLRSRAGASVVDRLASEDYAALLAVAAGMSAWHRSVRFCATCGAPTEAVRSGLQRQCCQCGSRFRPRVDPAMLVLVTDGDRCLLGRKASWPAGRFSALAGFVEFGETLEECVIREVREESGVLVDPKSICFVASQPWLFPRSLLLGFTAKPVSTEIKLTEELEDVKWFEADYIEACLAEADDIDASDTRFNIPSRTSLANSLIHGWLQSIRAQK